MLEMYLQTFGGRGSSGGNSPTGGRGGRGRGKAGGGTGTGRSTGQSKSEVSQKIKEARALAKKGAPKVDRNTNSKSPEEVRAIIGVARGRQLAASTARAGGAKKGAVNTQSSAETAAAIKKARALANKKRK